jgi:hypothetical protein
VKARKEHRFIQSTSVATQISFIKHGRRMAVEMDGRMAMKVVKFVYGHDYLLDSTLINQGSE